MRADTYQVLLIASGILVTTLFGVFLYREIFPEYKIYQNDYLALEEFRSTYTHQPTPSFNPGIKQIVIEREDRGPAIVNRCISCHVALQIPYFSPTKIAYDLNGHMIRDEKGHPALVPNEEYIWQKLDEKIAELRDEKVIEQLESQGQPGEVKQRLNLAKRYESLKVAHVNDQVYDVTKVLAMHPLMGNETRPFEYHPIEEYGCISCHSGNGQGLTTDKAHGPVFDGQYEIEYRGPVPKFTQPDPENDPRFARVFNDKPGHHLLFQTEPILPGDLIQSRCVQCHQTSDMQLTRTVTSTSNLALKREERLEKLVDAYEKEKQATIDLLKLQQLVKEQGYEKTLQTLRNLQSDYTLPTLTLEQISSQINYLDKAARGQNQEQAKSHILFKLNQDLVALIGSDSLVQNLEENYKNRGEEAINPFIKQHQEDANSKGSLFIKGEALDLNQDLMRHAQEVGESLVVAAQDQNVISALSSDIDELTRNYQRGKELYLSQACYACHRIAGFSRGGIGPELTYIGNSYPWYIKESMVWPQADLHNSTMPNLRLDHRELEDLMTFLLAQKGNHQAISNTDYQAALRVWEGGRKLSWEKPISPAKMYDLNYAMTVFATEGCSSCHRLQGFESNVGFKEEKNSSFHEIREQQLWFKKLFPEVVHFSYYDEELPGSEITLKIDKNSQEIDDRIISNVRQNSLLEEIDRNHPEAIEALYSNFRYASRSKDHFYQNLIKQEKDPAKIHQLQNEWKTWKDRVHRVLMMYIQMYGLGRLIGPHLNWSGIYRTDEWLMEHFRNPTGYVPRSIMPVLPFDETKFYALTYMLDQLAVRNRNHLRQIWDREGFDPKEVYDMLCAQCHGVGLIGNGVIAEWIYPIPKNLHNPEFLRNLTKEKVFYSITHGVKGTPMPSWGEVAEGKPENIQKISKNNPVLTTREIRYLVDWLFSALPGGEVIRQTTDVPKWQYTPEDVLEELKKEGGQLIPLPQKQRQNIKPQKPKEKTLPEENHPSPADKSMISFLLKDQEIYDAAIISKVYPRTTPKEDQQYNEVEEVFNIVPNFTDTGQTSYYIKKKYYTPYNIEEGQKFFLLNCAVCHGNEGDGSGARGGAMQEAKPRMLTNLDWIQSRDDLRLLRSIKYGVPGTSMTPWGDLTNALQRIQLVIFIRSLTRERERREKLDQVLYQVFDQSQFMIEGARIEQSQQILELQQKLKQLRNRQTEVERGSLEDPKVEREALNLYQQGLELERKINQLNEQDQQWIKLKEYLNREKELYFNLGINLINKDISDELLQEYIQMITLNTGRYYLQDHQLEIQNQEEINESIRKARKGIENVLEEKIGEINKQKQTILSKMASTQQREAQNVNQAELDSYKKLKTKLITDVEETIHLTHEQISILQNLENAVKPQQTKN